ncbi:lysosomal acid glucosylceramidase isoform X2 [Solenopsis invicta]|uniref:lysosomal acid glucosylceramidase isoform X2 n=1 Tax=Solenopsis invicta TaxID=13686 RepID=UPI00193EAB03|nr:lysosomal acid glucosylceramidase isoform X2 [Solenopsis invicta]
MRAKESIAKIQSENRKASTKKRKAARKYSEDDLVASNHEGPLQTSTSADHMKPWSNLASDESEDEHEDEDIRRTNCLVRTAEFASTNGCIRRRSKETGDNDGYYCVCNTKYCDEAPDAIRPLNSATYILITSSKSGLLFHVSNGVYKNIEEIDSSKQRSFTERLSNIFTAPFRILQKSVDSDPLGIITINRTEVYQEILGFGGAVTDSAAINIRNLTHEISDLLLRNYFGPHGINYNFIRTPMGGTDFSIRPYTYNMIENDTALDYFTLQLEDYAYKIPVIKRAQELKNGEIKLITAPWSASPWMKTKSTWTYSGKLHPEYRQLWADYFVKYFQAYRRNGLEFWATTPQNEPESYRYIPISVNLNAMAWTAEEERNWIIEYLAPTLERNNLGHIKIFTLDDNRLSLPDWPKTVFEDPRARNIVSGTAIHYYFDNVISPGVLDEVKLLFPEKSLIYTEACTGVFQDKRPLLGSWRRGEIYARNIIQTMSHWVSVWIDWNMALNTNGGPTWNGNYVDSPIIVNSTADEFYKQPMFYVLGHFSKYVPPNSVRIGTTSENTKGIQNIAFSTPDGAVVLVILNLNKENREILINDPEKGTTKIHVLGKSINTMKYW